MNDCAVVGRADPLTAHQSSRLRAGRRADPSVARLIFLGAVLCPASTPRPGVVLDRGLFGPVAQLGELPLCKRLVAGSIPAGSTAAWPPDGGGDKRCISGGAPLRGLERWSRPDLTAWKDGHLVAPGGWYRPLRDSPRSG